MGPPPIADSDDEGMTLGSTTLPRKLGREPLVDATFEIRFRGSDDANSDLLPGILYSELKEKYPNANALPLSNVPREMRRGEDLRYKPYQRLSSHDGNVSVYIGEQVVGVSNVVPYEGWERFRPRVGELLSLLRRAEVFGPIERFSLKAVNIIPPLGRNRQLDLLDLEFKVGGDPAPESGLQFRTEYQEEHLIRVLQVSPNATFTTNTGEERRGLLLSLDYIISVANGNAWDQVLDRLDDAHDRLKVQFFNLLTDETLKQLEPIYD